MAVAQEFIDLFVRISDVDRVYPGGVAGYLDHFADDIGTTIWHDTFLVREGAMSAADIQSMVDWWAAKGLKTHRQRNGKPVEWLGVCVSQGMSGGSTLPCEWIAYDPDTGGAYLKGTVPGALAGPERR